MLHEGKLQQSARGGHSIGEKNGDRSRRCVHLLFRLLRCCDEGIREIKDQIFEVRIISWIPIIILTITKNNPVISNREGEDVSELLISRRR